jgi:hypothetical protein
MRWHSIWPIWALAVAGAVVVAIAVPTDRIVWLPIVLGACTLASFGAQLALPTEKGLVDRLFASVGGAIVVLAAATVVFLALAIVD